MTRLFVYGTLKRGCRSHARLAHQAYLGDAQTEPGFQLYRLSGYPGLVRAPLTSDAVTGEVYLVDDSCLRELDEFEGVSEGLYTRETVPLRSPQAPAYAYVYAQSVEGRPLLGGNWSE